MICMDNFTQDITQGKIPFSLDIIYTESKKSEKDRRGDLKIDNCIK